MVKQFKIAPERVVSVGGETVVAVGRARIRRVRTKRRVDNMSEELLEPKTLKIGRSRLGPRRARKLECYKEKLHSFLRNVGYPLQEDSPLKVECVKEASLDKVRLEAPHKAQPLWLCKNHYEWVKERESKLSQWNVRVR